MADVLDKRSRTVLAVVALGALTMAAFGWHAWNQGPAGDSIDNNIGYLLLWPLFAGLLAWGRIRFRQLERDSATAVRNRFQDNVTREITSELLPLRSNGPDDPDPAMDAYNRYLADLNARELRHHLRAAGLDISDSPH